MTFHPVSETSPFFQTPQARARTAFQHDELMGFRPVGSQVARTLLDVNWLRPMEIGTTGARGMQLSSVASISVARYSEIYPESLLGRLTQYSGSSSYFVKDSQLYFENLAECIITSLGTYASIKKGLEKLPPEITGKAETASGNGKLLLSIMSSSDRASFDGKLDDLGIDRASPHRKTLWGLVLLWNLESARRLSGGVLNEVQLKMAMEQPNLSFRDAVNLICTDNVMSHKGASGKSQKFSGGKYERLRKGNVVIQKLIGSDHADSNLSNLKTYVNNFITALGSCDRYKGAKAEWVAKASVPGSWDALSFTKGPSIDRHTGQYIRKMKQGTEKELKESGSPDIDFIRQLPEYKAMVTAFNQFISGQDIVACESSAVTVAGEDDYPFIQWLIQGSASEGYQDVLRSEGVRFQGDIHQPDIDTASKFISYLREGYEQSAGGTIPFSRLKISDNPSMIYDMDMGKYKSDGFDEGIEGLLTRLDSVVVRNYLLGQGSLTEDISESDQKRLSALKRVYFDVETLRNPFLGFMNMVITKASHPDGTPLSLSDIFVHFNTMAPQGINSDEELQLQVLNRALTYFRWKGPELEKIQQTLALITSNYPLSREEISLLEKNMLSLILQTRDEAGVSGNPGKLLLYGEDDKPSLDTLFSVNSGALLQYSQEGALAVAEAGGILSTVSGRGNNCLINALLQHATGRYDIQDFNDGDAVDLPMQIRVALMEATGVGVDDMLNLEEHGQAVVDIINGMDLPQFGLMQRPLGNIQAMIYIPEVGLSEYERIGGGMDGMQYVFFNGNHFEAIYKA